MKTIAYQKFTAITVASLLLFAFTGCKKDDPPTANFTYQVAELSVSFTYAGTDAESYSWDFGDGNSSTVQNPSHTYGAGGTYTVVLTATNEDGDDEESQDVLVEASTAEAPQLSFGDADGAFYSINAVSVSNVGGFPVEVIVGSAVAWFVNGGTDFVDVGDVSFAQGSKSGTLDMNANNTYTWVETDFTSSGFNKSGGVEWTIDGGNGHGSISGLANGFPFPSTSEINESSDNISGSADYTLMHNGSISDADSTIFMISGPNGTVMKTVDGFTTSVTFTSTEMGTLGAGTGIMQIASYNIYDQALGGKKYYMVNESVASKNVTID